MISTQNYIFRNYTFEASHWLPKVPLTHKCHRMHGHTWKVKVEIARRNFDLDEEFDWVLDFGELDEIFEKHVMSKLDHRTLNDEIPNPTSEIVADWILTTIRNHFHYSPREIEAFQVTVQENDSYGAVVRYGEPWQV